MKIAIWTYMHWAFGQTHRAVQKHSKHEITLFDWRKEYDKDAFTEYDVVYIPVIQAHQSFCRKYPETAYKTCCMVRGKAELYNYSPLIGTRHGTTKEEIDSGILPEDVVSYINRLGIIGCVSKELKTLLEDQTTAQIRLTPCGFLPDIFDRETIPHDPFTVIGTCPRTDLTKSEHMYNAKRWDLIPEIEKRLTTAKILLPPRKLSMDEMADFYKEGDAILCLSHSEGNPLGLLEGAGAGLLPITTSVGIVPEIIQDGLTGIVLKETDEALLIEEAADAINLLASGREKTLRMRLAFKDQMHKSRTWKDVVPEWDLFFSEVYSRLHIPPARSVRKTSSKTFHLLGLVHLPCSKKYMGCAFTQKNHKLARMLLSLGHDVIYYGAEGSDVPCTEFVQTHTLSDIRKEWGSGDNRFEIGYDYFRHGFRHDFNATRTETTKKFYRTCIDHIKKNSRPDDFLLVTQGLYQKPIADEVNLFLTCEPGIGYRGSYAKYRAFESAFIQNFSYGSKNPFKSIDGNFYDRVIPNYFDPEDIAFSADKEDYFLYIGRVIKRKGILIADRMCRALNTRLIIAGQDGHVDNNGFLHNDFRMAPGTWEYVGFADVDKRKQLMAKAKATITATEYLEPFAGTHVESMLSGTPVISTGFGVFGGDTFTHGLHGFKCDTLDDFVTAGGLVSGLDPFAIRDHASRFLMDNVKWQYEKWFDDLYQVYRSATIKNTKGWNLVRDTEPEWRTRWLSNFSGEAVPDKPPREDLRDVTFTIPVFLDSEDRKRNLHTVVSYLTSHFDTNLIICEQDSREVEKLLSDFQFRYIPTRRSDGLLHRTMQLNLMALEADTPFIVNCDADILAEKQQYMDAVRLLREDKADMVLPYDLPTYHISREQANVAGGTGSFRHIGDPRKTCMLFCPESVGGLVFFRKEAFIAGGMENEFFLSWGREDRERYERFKKLGFRIGRVPGPLFHIRHEKTLNSSELNPRERYNTTEKDRILSMSAEDLRKEVSGWTWLPINTKEPSK